MGIALLGRTRSGIHGLLGSRSRGTPARSGKSIVGRVARCHVRTGIHIWNFLGLKSRVHQAGLVDRAGISGIGIPGRRSLLVVAIAGTSGSRGIGLLLGKVASGTSVAWSARSRISSGVKGFTGIEVVLLLLLLLLLKGRVLSRAKMLTRLVRLGVSILHSMGTARCLGAAFAVPTRRVCFEVFNHCSRQVPVGGDVVALNGLSSLWVLIVTGPHQGIVTQVAANVGGDDFAIDAVARDKVFVHASAGSSRCRRSVAGLS